MLIVIYEVFKKNNKQSPTKIKILCTILLIGMTLRYLVMILMFLVQNMSYLYLLKPLYFFNFICIPIAAFITLYILIRNDKINFSYIFFISAVLAGIYIFFIYKYPVSLKVDRYNGYFMEIIQASYVYIAYMLVNVFLVILGVKFYKKNIDKKGIILFILSAIFLIIETMLFFIGKWIFVNIVISDILWMLTLNYVLSKLKKIR
ncbi:hypothetical protein [Clostridium ganghwense]|nr:hypothetical protein [Clostridium ganghwense]